MYLMKRKGNETEKNLNINKDFINYRNVIFLMIGNAQDCSFPIWHTLISTVHYIMCDIDCKRLDRIHIYAFTFGLSKNYCKHNCAKKK